MAVVKTYKPGAFCWSDLGTPDVKKAKKFYERLFGWKSKDVSMGMGDAKYSKQLLAGKDVCALYAMFDGDKKAKALPLWLPYICVKNVDTTIKKVKAAGGTIAMGPAEITDKGRMAMIVDPSGAVSALWQARAHPGAGLSGVPGTVCWHDLNTPDPAIAGPFYSKVLGWKCAGKDFSGKDYHLFKAGKDGVGGMWPVAMKNLPTSWLTYWQVEKCAATVAKAKRLGARALMGPMEVPSMCRFAVLKDPQGAPFGVLEPL